MQMNEEKVRKAIEKERLQVTTLNIIVSIIASLIFIVTLCLTVILFLTNQKSAFLIIIDIGLLFLAISPFIYRKDLTPYYSGKSIHQKFEILEALKEDLNGTYTYKEAYYYKFFYTPNWWGLQGFVTILYAESGYYINYTTGQYPHLIDFGYSEKRANEIIDKIKEIEASQAS
jgi:hypothetical protein